ncbi:MAG: hypothetical protein ABSG62_19205 [Terracidiphilus sp.]
MIAVLALAVAADVQLERVSELIYQRLLAVAGNRPKERRMACFLSASGSQKEVYSRVAGVRASLSTPASHWFAPNAVATGQLSCVHLSEG